MIDRYRCQPFLSVAFRQKHLHQSLQTHHQQTLQQYQHVLHRFDLLQILTQFLISQVSSSLFFLHNLTIRFFHRTIKVTTNKSKVKIFKFLFRIFLLFRFSSTQIPTIHCELSVATSTSIFVILLFQKHIEQLNFTHQNELTRRTIEHQHQLETLERTHQDQIKEFHSQSRSIEVKKSILRDYERNDFSG